MKLLLKSALALTFMLGYSSCGGSDGSYSESYNYSNSAPSAMYTESYAADYAGEGFVSGTGAMLNAKEAGISNEEALETPSPTQEPSSAPTISAEKLVYTGSITVETLEYENSVKSIRERIKKYQGIIEREDEWDGDNSWYYTDGRSRSKNRNLTMTLRIPTKDFENFLNDMEGAGKITSRSQNVENITRKYNDNSIEIQSLELQEQRLMEMMGKANTVEEMIMIEGRLSDVQTRLNQKKSYRSSMDTDVMYSTIYLNLNEVQKYTPTVDPGIDIGGFGERLIDTLEYSGKFFILFLQNLILFVIRIAPFAILIGLIIWAIKAYRKKKGLDPRIFRFQKKDSKEVVKINPGTPKE